MCWECRRPVRVCYCASVQPIETQTRVVILQHPRESDVPINTARIAELALANATLHVGLDFGRDATLSEALSNPAAPPVLLYPSDDARDLSRYPPPGPVTLVVIDGTWWQASKLFKLNPFLHALPRYGLAPSEESRYRIRREPAAHCLSTIEALEAALSLLERRAGGFPELLKPFDTMVETQLDFVNREHRPRHRRSVEPRLRPLVAPALSERSRGSTERRWRGRCSRFTKSSCVSTMVSNGLSSSGKPPARRSSNESAASSASIVDKQWAA